LTNISDKNLHHISAEFGNLEARIILFDSGVALNKANKYVDTPLMVNGEGKVILLQA
jgi:hypothetical protein